MVDAFGWQSIFYINVPIGLIAFVIAIRLVAGIQEPRGAQPRHPRPDSGRSSAWAPHLRLHRGEQRTAGAPPRIVTLLVVGLVALGVFGFWEARVKSPMLQLSFFRNMTFLGANLVGLAVSFGFFGMLFFLAPVHAERAGLSRRQARRPPAARDPAVMVVGHRLRPDRGSRSAPGYPSPSGWSWWVAASSLSRPSRPTTPYSRLLVDPDHHGGRHRPGHEPHDHRSHEHRARGPGRDGVGHLEHHPPGRRCVRHRAPRLHRDGPLRLRSDGSRSTRWTCPRW